MGKLHLLWCGLVIRTYENSFAKIGLNIPIDGKQPKCRPKQRWLDTLDGELRTSRLHPDQALTEQNGATEQDELMYLQLLHIFQIHIF